MGGTLELFKKCVMLGFDIAFQKSDGNPMMQPRSKRNQCSCFEEVTT